MTNLPTHWTRSIQRVEGVPIVVDIRDGLPSLCIYRTASNGRGTEQLAGGDSLAIATRVRDLLGELMPSTRITVRFDSALRFGANDTADSVSRALRSHLAGVNVEQMS